MRSTKPILVVTALALIAIAIVGYFRSNPTQPGVTKDDIERDQQHLPISSSGMGQIDHVGAAAPSKKSSVSSFGDVKAEAMAGSSFAQRKLSEIYDNCMAYSLNPAAWLGTLDAMALVNPGEKAGIERVKSHFINRCSEVDGGEPIPSEAATLWLQQSAKNGDVAAQIRLRTLSPKPLLALEATELMDAAVGSHDPATMIGLSELLARTIEGDLPAQYANLAGSPTIGAAWGVAACQLGAECAEGSPLMDALCSGTGKCSYNSYTEYLTNEVVPAGQAKEFYKTVEYILGLYGK